MKKLAWLLGLLVFISVGVVAYVGYRFMEQEGFKGAVYDRYPPQVEVADARIRILLFSKTNGVRHESIDAAIATFQELADQWGWSVYVTDNGAVHSPELLDKFNIVIWNNVTGDVLLPGQRSALQLWVEQGGRFFGIHATGGNRSYSWDWRPFHMIGARFKGHTLFPETRTGVMSYENHLHRIVRDIPEKWAWEEEWYSFRDNPRHAGAQIVLTVDENSYQPFDYLKMGAEHPVVWYQGIKQGVTLYSALGHRPEGWQDETYRTFIRNCIEWLASPRSQPVGPPAPLEADTDAEATDEFADDTDADY